MEDKGWSRKAQDGRPVMNGVLVVSPRPGQPQARGGGGLQLSCKLSITRSLPPRKAL